METLIIIRMFSPPSYRNFLIGLYARRGRNQVFSGRLQDWLCFDPFG
jgi:hypothetical protein